MDWFKRVVMQHYADFNGRASRSEYWFYILFYLIFAIVIGMVDGFVTGGVIAGLYSLALLVPSIAVLARRLHDSDRSGWWILIVFLPLIGGLVLLVFAVLPGTQGDNRFGPPAPTTP